MIGARLTCTRMLSRRNNLNSVLWFAIGAPARGIGGISAALAWETRTDETARRIIHNDLSPQKRRRLGGYVAYSLFLAGNCKSPRINDRCVWSMAHVLETNFKGIPSRSPCSRLFKNGAHYPSYIWKCIKLRSANCRKNWFPRPLYFRLYGLNPFSASTGIISMIMHAAVFPPIDSYF